MPGRVELRIAGDTVQKSRSRAGVQGEGNVTDLVCSFDASWDDLAKTLTFWDAEMANPVKIVLTENLLTEKRRYTVKIPPEPLKIAGNCTVTVDGALDGVRARTVGVELEVAYSPITDGASEPVDPTPTQAEQLQAATDAAAKLAKEAKNLAEKQGAVVVTYGQGAVTVLEDAVAAGKIVVCRRECVEYDEDSQTYYYLLSTVETNGEHVTYHFTNGEQWAVYDVFEGASWSCGEHETGEKNNVVIVNYGEDNYLTIEAAVAAGKTVICRRNYIDNVDVPMTDYYLLSYVNRSDADWDFVFTNRSGWASCYPSGEELWTYGEHETGASAHADTHATGGSDPITPESIGALPALGESIADPETNIDELTLTKCYLCGSTVIKKGLKGDLPFKASHLLKVEDFTGSGKRAIQTAVLNNKDYPLRKWRLWNGTVWSEWVDTDGKVAALEKQIVTLEERIAALEQRITDLENGTEDDTAETITFTVNGTQYTAPEGMTWDEFVASDYNKKDEYGNSMFNIYSGNVYYIAWYDSESEEDGSPFYSWIREFEEGIFQAADMSILPGVEYNTDD